jgi:hypothetical protein
MEDGLASLELARRAADLFEKQREKRRLLDFVLSNWTWADGVLAPEFRRDHPRTKGRRNPPRWLSSRQATRTGFA